MRGWLRQIARDEADMPVPLSAVPFDLGHDAARLATTLHPVDESGVMAPLRVRWSSEGVFEQGTNPALLDVVGW